MLDKQSEQKKVVSKAIRLILTFRNNVFAEEVRRGLLCMSQRIIGSNTLIQGKK